MIRHIPKVALLLGALAIAGQASADGRGWGGPGLVVGAVVGAVVAGAVMSSNQPRTVYVEPHNRSTTRHRRHLCTINRS